MDIQSVSLNEFGAGKRVRVRYLHAGRMASARLAAMGIRPGQVIEVLSNPSVGPFIVSVHGSRVVLGRGIAAHIAVVPEEKRCDAPTGQDTKNGAL